MILGHYLIVQRWTPEFFPHEDQLQRGAVWLRILGLPIEYYGKHILWWIENSIGTTVKVDSNTLQKKANDREGYTTERAKFTGSVLRLIYRKCWCLRSNSMAGSTRWSMRSLT